MLLHSAQSYCIIMLQKGGIMLIGYARVSTQDQDLDAQISALKNAGCQKIFQEKEKGGRWDRPQFHKLMDHIKEGDVVIVWKLDRLSRSLKDLLAVMERIDSVGCGFKSLTEPVDTTTPAGRMMMQIIGAFAEFEKAILRERTMVGLSEAKKKGRVGGRKFILSKDQTFEAIELIKSGSKSAASVARLFNVDPSTISRMMQRYGDDSRKLLLRR